MFKFLDYLPHESIEPGFVADTAGLILERALDIFTYFKNERHTNKSSEEQVGGIDPATLAIYEDAVINEINAINYEKQKYIWNYVPPSMWCSIRLCGFKREVIHSL